MCVHLLVLLVAKYAACYCCEFAIFWCCRTGLNLIPGDLNVIIVNFIISIPTIAGVNVHPFLQFLFSFSWIDLKEIASNKELYWYRNYHAKNWFMFVQIQWYLSFNLNRLEFPRDLYHWEVHDHHLYNFSRNFFTSQLQPHISHRPWWVAQDCVRPSRWVAPDSVRHSLHLGVPALLPGLSSSLHSSSSCLRHAGLSLGTSALTACTSTAIGAPTVS